MNQQIWREREGTTCRLSSNTEFLLLRTFSVVLFFILAIVFYKALNYGLDRQAVIDCEKWQGYAQDFPLWYATDGEREQCDAVGKPLPPDAYDRAQLAPQITANGFYSDSDQADYIARLAIEAPETLQPPQEWMFANINYYQSALARYALKGNWATEPEDWQN
jgi:hypothetical protein